VNRHPFASLRLLLGLLVLIGAIEAVVLYRWLA